MAFIILINSHQIISVSYLPNRLFYMVSSSRKSNEKIKKKFSGEYFQNILDSETSPSGKME